MSRTVAMHLIYDPSTANALFTLYMRLHFERSQQVYMINAKYTQFSWLHALNSNPGFSHTFGGSKMSIISSCIQIIFTSLIASASSFFQRLSLSAASVSVVQLRADLFVPWSAAWNWPHISVLTSKNTTKVGPLSIIHRQNPIDALVSPLHLIWK